MDANGIEDQADLEQPSPHVPSSSSVHATMMEDFEILHKYSHRGPGAVRKQTTLTSFMLRPPSSVQDNDTGLLKQATLAPSVSKRPCTRINGSYLTDAKPMSTTINSSSLGIETMESQALQNGASVADVSSLTVPQTNKQTIDTESSKGACARKESRPKKMCPFYKKVPGTGFTVDAFKYGSIPGCTGYFLSHFHADHYQGLNKRFQGTLYCTKVTANLVIRQIKVSSSCIHTLSLNEPHLIDGVQVILLEANHCPGAVLLLFKLASGRNYLHTGDFRFCSSMLNYPELSCLTVHELYLDTTYCNPKYNFPKQDQAISFAVGKSLEAIQKNPKTLIVCGTYTIGKEKVFQAIAETLGIEVCVNKDKKAILDCLESEWMSQYVHTDPHSTSLHILPIWKLNMTYLDSYLEQFGNTYTALVAFKPTGWTYGGQGGSLSSIKPHVNGSISIYGIPYSEHSSYPELREFVQFLRPHKIIPTVDNFSASRRDEMQKMFKEWLSSECSTSHAKKQVTLDAFRTSHS